MLYQHLLLTEIHIAQRRLRYIMSSYALTGPLALAYISTPFTTLSIIIYPLVIVPSPEFARFTFICTAIISLFATYQLYTTSQKVQACNYASYACENKLHNATQRNAVLESKLENRPMEGVTALRAEKSKCETDKSGLRWFRGNCRAHC